MSVFFVPFSHFSPPNSSQCVAVDATLYYSKRPVSGNVAQLDACTALYKCKFKKKKKCQEELEIASK